MSSEKENMRPKSEIPAAKEKALLTNKNVPAGAVRNPLKVLSGANSIAGSSRNILVETRHITYRHQKEDLDWKYEVYGAHAVDDRLIDRLNPHYLLDNFNYLLQLEQKTEERPALGEASRARIVNWILKVYGVTDGDFDELFGWRGLPLDAVHSLLKTKPIYLSTINSGNPAVVQQACCYLDKYLNSTVVTVSRLQVTAAACLWIAAKFSGDRYLSGKRLVERSDLGFVKFELISAERNILRTLNFQAQTVVPQDFVPYFAWHCGVHRADVETAATFICLCGLTVDGALDNEYPSVIAAAAINLSLKYLHKTACKERVQSCPIYRKTIKKTYDLSRLCKKLEIAVRRVHFRKCDFKALICRYGGPPKFIAKQIFKNL